MCDFNDIQSDEFEECDFYDDYRLERAGEWAIDEIEALEYEDNAKNTCGNCHYWFDYISPPQYCSNCGQPFVSEYEINEQYQEKK